jgi:hypothetical protein
VCRSNYVVCTFRWSPQLCAWSVWLTIFQLRSPYMCSAFRACANGICKWLKLSHYTLPFDLITSIDSHQQLFDHYLDRVRTLLDCRQCGERSIFGYGHFWTTLNFYLCCVLLHWEYILRMLARQFKNARRISQPRRKRASRKRDFKSNLEELFCKMWDDSSVNIDQAGGYGESPATGRGGQNRTVSQFRVSFFN